jgi:plastocyanin
MIRASIAVAVAAAATILISSAAFAQPSATVLRGTVGPGFTIKLTIKGVKVKTLKAGRYTFVISDRASIHNFVVEQESGGTFERALTTVQGKGTKTVTLTLKKGKWKYYCKPHESGMFGFFTVR